MWGHGSLVTRSASFVSRCAQRCVILSNLYYIIPLVLLFRPTPYVAPFCENPPNKSGNQSHRPCLLISLASSPRLEDPSQCAAPGDPPPARRPGDPPNASPPSTPPLPNPARRPCTVGGDGDADAQLSSASCIPSCPPCLVRGGEADSADLDVERGSAPLALAA